jgi:hypothetical protein
MVMPENYAKAIDGNLFLPLGHVPPEKREIPEKYVTFKWKGEFMAGKNPTERDGFWDIQVLVPCHGRDCLMKTYQTTPFPAGEISELKPYVE